MQQSHQIDDRFQSRPRRHRPHQGRWQRGSAIKRLVTNRWSATVIRRISTVSWKLATFLPCSAPMCRNTIRRQVSCASNGLLPELAHLSPICRRRARCPRGRQPDGDLPGVRLLTPAHRVAPGSMPPGRRQQPESSSFKHWFSHGRAAGKPRADQIRSRAAIGAGISRSRVSCSFMATKLATHCRGAGRPSTRRRQSWNPEQGDADQDDSGTPHDA